jgi:hypothetical protein
LTCVTTGGASVHAVTALLTALSVSFAPSPSTLPHAISESADAATIPIPTLENSMRPFVLAIDLPPSPYVEARERARFGSTQ